MHSLLTGADRATTCHLGIHRENVPRLSTPGTRKEAGQEEIGAYKSFVQMRALSGNMVKIRVFSTIIGPLLCRRIGGETVVNI